MSTTTDLIVEQASAALSEAITHHVGPLDLGAHQPIVRAISEYGQRCRERDEDATRDASQHVYAALTHKFGPLDLGANDGFVKALAAYGQACREAGPKA